MMNTLIRIIRNGRAYGVVFFALSFMLGYYTFNLPLDKAILISTPIAILSLIIHGLIHSRFTKPLKSLEGITVTPQDVETVRLQAPANYVIDDHLVSGKLFLTDKRLVFKSYHKEEGEQKEYSWSLLKLHPFNFFPSIFNTGGEFILRDDSDNQLVFEVDELKLWKRALK